MAVSQSKDPPPSERASLGFGRFLFAGLLWLAVGVLAGRYLFPEVKIEVVERRVEVEKRVEVPVVRIVEKRVEIPIEVTKYVDRVVEKRVEVPMVADKSPVRRAEGTFETINQAKLAKSRGGELPRDQDPADKLVARAWAAVTNGMSKSEVETLLGPPQASRQDNERLYWFFERSGEVVGCVVFGGGGLLSSYRVVEVQAPVGK